MNSRFPPRSNGGIFNFPPIVPTGTLWHSSARSAISFRTHFGRWVWIVLLNGWVDLQLPVTLQQIPRWERKEVVAPKVAAWVVGKSDHLSSIDRWDEFLAAFEIRNFLWETRKFSHRCFITNFWTFNCSLHQPLRPIPTNWRWPPREIRRLRVKSKLLRETPIAFGSVILRTRVLNRIWGMLLRGWKCNPFP